MADDTLSLEVASTDLEAFALCLTLGTLEAMRGGQLPLESGIWTLGRPCFWQALETAGITPAFVNLLMSADELSTLVKLRGVPAAQAAIDEMITLVRLRLSALPQKSWHARWATKI